MADNASRFICAPCAVIGDVNATICDTCSATLTPPSIFDCARLGMLPELEQLIKEDPQFDVNALEPSTQATLLHHAAINSKMRVLEFLAHTYRDALTVDVLGGVELRTTPLFWAAYHNHIYAVELLLRSGADASFTDANGFCAFLVALHKCFPILAAYLVAKGTAIDVRVQDTSQRTGLMLLCHHERFHLDSFRMVLSLGADVNATDSDGNTALHHAVLNDLGLAVKMLLDKGASPTARNQSNQTPCDVAHATLDERSLARHLLEEDAQLQTLARVTRLPKPWLEANLFKLSFFVPWVVIPAFAWILVTTTSGIAMLLLQEVTLVAAAMGVLKVLQRGTYGDKRKAAALMFGINVASVFWLVLCLPWLVEGADVGLLFQGVVYTSAALILVFLYLSAVTDAGTVVTTYQEKIHNIRTLVESKSPSATKLCLTCLHKRPLRAKHCAELNACIAKFDHYCPFVVNAVGAENHHYFVGFLCCAVVAISMELAVCYWVLKAQPDVIWTQGIVVGLWSLVHFQPLLVCVAALALLHDVWIGYLLFFHCYLIGASLTTNEVVKNENLERAYSRGVRQNVVDFFRLGKGPRVDWRTLYRLDEFVACITSASDTKKEA